MENLEYRNVFIFPLKEAKMPEIHGNNCGLVCGTPSPYIDPLPASQTHKVDIFTPTL